MLIRHVRSAAVLLILCVVAPALAHDFRFTETRAQFRADGTFQIDLIADLDALALGQPPTTDNATLAAQIEAMSSADREKLIADLRTLFQKRTRLRFDGVEFKPEVEFPGPAATPANPPALALAADSTASTVPTSTTTTAAPPTALHTALGIVARLTGRVPSGAQHFTFWASRSFQCVHIWLSRDGSDKVLQYVLDMAEESPEYALHTANAEQSALAVAGQYVKLGYEHIVPEGLDHMLFVLGLFLLSTRLRPLLWQISAFTVAHTVTLALSTYGVVRLPPSIVEPLIALSIAYVAIENIFTPELHTWRPALVFCFGLLHGMGFAGALAELGLPQGQYANALVSFNVGVELGQLSVIAAAFLLVGWFRNAAWYRKGIVIPGSALIACVGLYWSVERAFFL